MTRSPEASALAQEPQPTPVATAPAGPSGEPRPVLRRIPWFAIAACGLILLRFAHMGELLDGPHVGRQCDTAYYAWAFYRDGINLLRPSVCWLGNEGTMAFEFPLPEALMALAYHLFGPKILYARIVTLLFFVGATYYFYRIVEYVRGARAARLAALLYLAMPLALNYSRAVHVDFHAVCFAHAMLYYLLRGYDEERTGLVVVGSLLGALAFTIKAPYAFYVFLPFGVHILPRLKIRKLLGWAPILALPLVAFALWRWHVHRVNSAAPDLSFLPQYHKFVDMGAWYFGSLSQRLQLSHWRQIVIGFVWTGPGSLGAYFLMVGLVARPAEGRGLHFFRAWLVGTAVYLAIFFNLNVVHDYYRIPFLAPAALFMAVGLEWLFFEMAPRPGLWGKLPLAATLLLLCGSFVHRAEAVYYDVDWLIVSAARHVQAETAEDALVVLALSPKYAGHRTDYWNEPRLFYNARRVGWALPLKHLDETTLRGLTQRGATHVAVLVDEPLPPRVLALLEGVPSQHFELKVRPWRLHLYSLGRRPGLPRDAKPPADGAPGGPRR